MNINEYIKTINDLNLLIENLNTTSLETNINQLSADIRGLRNRIDVYKQNLPYSYILLNFNNEVKLTVRSASVVSEETFKDRQEFNVVGWVRDKYLILQKDEWDSHIGLKLFYDNLDKRVPQRNDIQLFYNEYEEVSTGYASRKSFREEIEYEIITLK